MTATMEKTSFTSYGEYSSANYGVNAMVFDDAYGNRFWFSYHTLIAFSSHKTGFVIRENIWGPTTGKHLNWIDSDKSKRVDTETFEAKYQEAFAS